MKIYTKKGDTGQTGLIGGTRVSKNHHRIEAYGTVDELNSWMGLVADESGKGEKPELYFRIQDRLFTLGAALAMDPEKGRMSLPELTAQDSVQLEEEIDRMEEELKPLTTFILPGGLATSSHVQIARTVCRRAERKVVGLAEEQRGLELHVQYLNRLSDYLFVLARYRLKMAGKEEKAWIPEKKA